MSRQEQVVHHFPPRVHEALVWICSVDVAPRCGHRAWWPVGPRFGKCGLCLPRGCGSEAHTAQGPELESWTRVGSGEAGCIHLAFGRSLRCGGQEGAWSLWTIPLLIWAEGSGQGIDMPSDLEGGV